MKTISKTKLNSKNNLQNSLRGFTIGITMIILSIILTVSMGMSMFLLRDLKQLSITEKSSIAYNIADAALSCVTSYEDNIKYNDGITRGGFYPNSTSYDYVDSLTTNNYRENYTGNLNIYKRDTITCFDKKILDNNITASDVSYEGDLNKTNILAVTPDSDGDPSTGFYYAGGVKTVIDIQDNEMKSLYNACAQVEVYALGNSSKLFISHGRVPCTGDNVLEKVIVKSSQ